MIIPDMVKVIDHAHECEQTLCQFWRVGFDTVYTRDEIDDSPKGLDFIESGGP